MGVQVQVDVLQQELKHLATRQENKAGKLLPLRAALEIGRWQIKLQAEKLNQWAGWQNKTTSAAGKTHADMKDQQS